MQARQQARKRKPLQLLPHVRACLEKCIQLHASSAWPRILSPSLLCCMTCQAPALPKNTPRAGSRARGVGGFQHKLACQEGIKGPACHHCSFLPPCSHPCTSFFLCPHSHLHASFSSHLLLCSCPCPLHPALPPYSLHALLTPPCPPSSYPPASPPFSPV